MVDRYDPGISYDPQPDGEYVLYTDYKALCDAVEAYFEAEEMFDSACDSRDPDAADHASDSLQHARDHVLALVKKGKR